MNKYIALAVLPFFASCNSVENKRPSYDTGVLGESSGNKGLYYPHMVVDQSATSSLDVTQDIGGMFGNVGRHQTTQYGTTVIKSTGRGSRIVSNEIQAGVNTVGDIGDGVAVLTAEQIDTYPNIVVDATGRVLNMGGTILGAGFKSYGNVVDGAWNGVFGGLFKGVFIDTKPYMVGSANDLWVVAGMPGASWKGPLPQMPPPVAYVEETSSKSVTYSK